MTPTAINPIVVVQVNGQGAIVNAATNTDMELKVVTVTNRDAFDKAALGIMFNSTNSVTGAKMDLVSLN